MRRPLSIAACFVLAVAIALSSWAAEADSEGDLFQRTNSERASAGVATLSQSGSLLDVARRHSQRMADEGRIYHNDNLPNEVSGWRKLGENVAKGSDPADIHRAFMDSDNHRKNILDPDFVLAAVGIVRGGDGYLYVTEVFMRPAEQTQAAQPAATQAPQRRIRLSSNAPAVAASEPPAQAPAPPAPAPVKTVRPAMFVDDVVPVSNKVQAMAVDVPIHSGPSELNLLLATLAAAMICALTVLHGARRLVFTK